MAKRPVKTSAKAAFSGRADAPMKASYLNLRTGKQAFSVARSRHGDAFSGEPLDAVKSLIEKANKQV
ncbi:hypothetical protein [Hyphococcus sp.]|uniref:hypothetical protein n=1 Tax=Hyphococcus sp. TaxID=2038636 RepID=UPI0035C7606B